MAVHEVYVEHVNQDTFPEPKGHPQLAKEFVELGTFTKHSPQTRTDGNLRSSRFHNDIRNSDAHFHPDYDIYLCGSNMALWKIVM
jgi:hypothetical protein